MGIINHPIKLDILVQEYEIKNFVETGTGDGSSMKIALDSNLFEDLYGIELDEELYNRLLKLFLDNKVKFYNGYSKDEMFKVVDELNNHPTLYWLDAHFPGADYKGQKYDAEKDDSKRIPLEVELKILSENRDISKDVFVIDDLRVYKDGPYEAGSWEFRATAGAKNCDFIEELIGKTHVLVEHYADQGYMLAYPIDSEESKIRSTIIGE
jgi:hypothetical protein